MKEQDIESVLSELQTSSKTSLIMVILGALCLFGSIYYSATRLTPLENKISGLTNKIKALESDMILKQSELDKLERKLKLTNTKLKVSIDSLVFLQEGTRYLLVRQYKDAIDSFNEYLKSFPDSPEALNFVGYAELRYAQYWRENSLRDNITATQKQEYIDATNQYALSAEQHLIKAINLKQQYLDATNQYALSAEQHLIKAINLKQQYSWPRYNLALLYFQGGKKQESLSELSTMLSETPNMIKWLCEDGQFRKMKIDKDTTKKFTLIVDNAAEAEGKASCWVTKKPVKRKR